MNDALHAVAALADILAAENAALETVDYAAAARLADVKRRATAAVATLCKTGTRLPRDASSEQRQIAMSAFQRLLDLIDENRRSLERAIVVQGRVIDCVLRAVPQSPLTSSRYGSTGVIARSPSAVPMSFRAHA